MPKLLTPHQLFLLKQVSLALQGTEATAAVLNAVSLAGTTSGDPLEVVDPAHRRGPPRGDPSHDPVAG